MSWIDNLLKGEYGDGELVVVRQSKDSSDGGGIKINSTCNEDDEDVERRGPVLKGIDMGMYVNGAGLWHRLGVWDGRKENLFTRSPGKEGGAMTSSLRCVHQRKTFE